MAKEKQLTQPIKWGTSGFKKALAVIRKRKQREKELEEADGEEPEQKKRKVPTKFKKALRSSMSTYLSSGEGNRGRERARTQWLDVFKSLPNNTLSNALACRVRTAHGCRTRVSSTNRPRIPRRRSRPITSMRLCGTWYDEPTGLLTVVKHVHAQMPGYMEETRDSGIGLKGTFEYTPGLYGETNPDKVRFLSGVSSFLRS
jgi:hypothetical protein